MNDRAILAHESRNEICWRMAEAILEIIELQGRCSIFDLHAMGFSLDEAAQYWPEASALAEAMKHKAWYGVK